MNSELNTSLLAGMLKTKRGSTGLRDTAAQIGDISSATLSRIEQGKLPDVETFIKICKWLEVTTETFIISNKEQKVTSSKDKILAHLRADRELDPDTMRMLTQVIDLAYNKK
ncbi:helix-turn-helix domain-containing protein [Maribacter polysaccharolyticus]|uniref:helix-turn-helix domain-containing protein n=1 Tax=Maribacter polysaccharolyticus TaxID=3020831 RepID=UPI00237FC621|nr:helix-turn-helix transcriptional regulator [Maribacter polysaccharolyticus]MDE3741173.1 helix-turn-helix transcriptional regulator [Maribacter polysaccharolyticus]